MKLSKYLTPQCLVLLNGSTKEAVLKELSDVLAEQLNRDSEDLEKDIWKREDLMSTGIGNGLAIPHIRIAGISRPALAVGVSAGGISDYVSLDNKPVHIIVLIAAPEGQHDTYIRLLAAVTDVLHHDDLRQKMLEVEQPDQLRELFVEVRS